MIPKCKLCGAEAKQDRHSGFTCTGCGCQFNKIYFTEEEWLLINSDWVTITDDPASLPKERGKYAVMIQGKSEWVARWWFCPQQITEWIKQNVIAWQHITPHEVKKADKEVKDGYE